MFGIEMTRGVDEEEGTNPPKEPSNEDDVEHWWDEDDTVDIGNEVSSGLQDGNQKFDLLAAAREEDERDHEPGDATVEGILVLFHSVEILCFGRKSFE